MHMGYSDERRFPEFRHIRYSVYLFIFFFNHMFFLSISASLFSLVPYSYSYQSR